VDGKKEHKRDANMCLEGTARKLAAPQAGDERLGTYVNNFCSGEMTGMWILISLCGAIVSLLMFLKALI